jgi:N-acetyl-1-D-myo-inositol-2-amino-2-deoxy-alpha-D-glucopyranoside deacetylase
MTITPEGEPASAPTTSGDPDGVDALLEEAADIVDGIAETELGAVDLAAMDALDQPRRLLLVHAHPDDETIGNGATMARYAAAGAGVTLVTCTRGERGEVVDEELAHLEGDRPALAAHRVLELGTAMEALGVSDHRFLDDAPLEGEDAAVTAGVHYEDSGMAWDPAGGVRAVPAPDTSGSAFALADVEEAASRLAGVLREVRPQVLLTYEPGGGYGHPDHVQAAAVARRAVELAADPGAPLVAGTEPWQVAKVYEGVVPASASLAVRWPDEARPSMVVDDAEVTAVVDAPEQLGAKVAALRAHRSQVRVRHHDGEWQMCVAADLWQPVSTSEAYRLSRASAAGTTAPAGGRESDLFAGLAL